MTKQSDTGQPQEGRTPDQDQGHAAKELTKATFGAMAGVVLSRLSGLFRQQILSVVFGAGVATDAFYVAFRYPNALRDLLADGALSSAFTKSLVEAKARGVEEERRLISTTVAFFGLVTLALAAVGLYFSHPFMSATTSTAFQERGGVALASPLFKILAFYLPLTMLSACAMAALGTHRKTFRATFASVFFNAGTILGALAVAPILPWIGVEPIFGLAIGAMMGATLQVAFLNAPLRALGLLTWPRLRLSDFRAGSPLREILAMMTPRALSQGSNTIALFINTLLASAGAGTITYISNASIIILVPVGLFGVASGFSSLPVLTEAIGNKNGTKFSLLLGQSLYSALWFALFSVLGFALLALPFCGVLFQHGNFSRPDATATAMAVCAYGIGVFFNTGSKVLQQGFFALGQTRQVVINSLVYLVVNATCSWYFSRHNSGPVPFGLSNSLAASCDFALNLFFLQRLSKRSGFNFFEAVKPLGLRAGTTVLMAFLTVGIGVGGIVLASRTDGLLTRFGLTPGFFTDLALLLIVGSALATLFFALTRLVGPTNLRELVRRIESKLLTQIRRHVR
jgi:putative peptidoglycan lipid II flippase